MSVDVLTSSGLYLYQCHSVSYTPPREVRRALVPLVRVSRIGTRIRHRIFHASCVLVWSLESVCMFGGLSTLRYRYQKTRPLNPKPQTLHGHAAVFWHVTVGACLTQSGLSSLQATVGSGPLRPLKKECRVQRCYFLHDQLHGLCLHGDLKMTWLW